MTCIVGIETSTGVLLGADSVNSSGWTTQVKADSKIWRKSDVGYGLSGSPRMGQLIRYRFEAPEWNATTNLSRFMATDFVDALRDVLKAGGHAEKENEKERTDSSFLVAIRGEVFHVQGDYQTTRYAQGFAAIGSGQLLALGALHATQDLDNPKARVRLALEAASEFSGNVGPPFHFLEVPK